MAGYVTDSGVLLRVEPHVDEGEMTVATAVVSTADQPMEDQRTYRLEVFDAYADFVLAHAAELQGLRVLFSGHLAGGGTELQVAVTSLALTLESVGEFRRRLQTTP